MKLLLGLWSSKKVTSESRGSVGNTCERAHGDGGGTDRRMCSEFRKVARGEPLPQTELGANVGLSHWY